MHCRTALLTVNNVFVTLLKREKYKHEDSDKMRNKNAKQRNTKDYLFIRSPLKHMNCVKGINNKSYKDKNMRELSWNEP